MSLQKKVISGISVIVVAFVFGLWIGRISAVRAESENRVFELRTYTAVPGKVPEVHAMFRDHASKVFKKHQMTAIGYWAPTDEPASKNTFVYLLAFPSRDAAAKSWDAFRNDPDWKKFRDEAQATGWPVAKTESLFMEPLDFSPLK